MAEPAPQPSRHALDGVFAAIRAFGVRRNTDDRWLAGVCSGVAQRLGIDPLVVRGALIVLLFLGGVGGLAYLVAWALLPDRNGRILAEEALRGDGGGIVLLVVIGIVVVSNAVERWWLWTVLVPVLVVGWWAVHSARTGRTPEEMGEQARRLANRLAGGGAGQPAAASPPAHEPGPYATAGTSASPTAFASVPSAAASPSAAGPDPAAPAGHPHGMGPGRTGTVAAPERVVHRPRPRGGLLALLLAGGLAAAGYGMGAALATTRGWTGSHELVGLAFALAGAGVALAVVGLTGRRAGLTTFLTGCLAVVAVAGTAIPALPAGGFGERAWSAAAQPADGFALTAGAATLTLAGATSGSTVRADIGAGELRIAVPKNVTATVTSTVRVGEVQVRRGTDVQKLSGGMGAAANAPVTVGTGPTRVAVEVHVSAGQVVITQEP